MTPAGPVGPTHHNTTSATRLHPDAANYERFIKPFVRPFAIACANTLTRMLSAPRPTDPPLLDLGAGTGLVTSLLLKRRPAAKVVCLDPSAALLSAVTQNESRSVVCGTATSIDPDQRFSGIACNFVVPFMPDPAADFAHLRQTLPAGAPMVVTTLGPIEQNEPFHAYWSTLHELNDQCWAPERYVHSRFGTEPAFRSVFESDLYEIRQVRRLTGTRRISPQNAWTWLSRTLPVGIGESYSTPPPELLEAAKHRFLNHWADRHKWSTSGLLIVALASATCGATAGSTVGRPAVPNSHTPR
jgi:SAM-dependent methyltransferase